MKNHKAWEELTIADDYMFKLVMSHKRICKHLLEMLLRIRIRDLKEPETEKAMKHGYESKGIRLDVFVEDDAQTVYDIDASQTLSRYSPCPTHPLLSVHH